MRHDEHIEELLRQWGAAQNGRVSWSERGEDREAPDVHPIARSIPFAPKTRHRAALRLAGRDGESRLRLMASRAGVQGMRKVPTWAADPIRCKETRLSGPIAAVDGGIPPNLMRVHQAMLDLYRRDPKRGLCLRLQYTMKLPHAELAERVSQAIGEPVNVRAYREELKMAREWVAMKLVA